LQRYLGLIELIRVNSLSGGADSMSVDVRPAMPAVFPRAAAFRARRDRVRRWFATMVTVLTAAIAILVVAAAAVVMGIT
jgi:hypothetical protein